jgi:hypothetical protein
MHIGAATLVFAALGIVVVFTLERLLSYRRSKYKKTGQSFLDVIKSNETEDCKICIFFTGSNRRIFQSRQSSNSLQSTLYLRMPPPLRPAGARSGAPHYPHLRRHDALDKSVIRFAWPSSWCVGRRPPNDPRRVRLPRLFERGRGSLPPDSDIYVCRNLGGPLGVLRAAAHKGEKDDAASRSGRFRGHSRSDGGTQTRARASGAQ